MVIDGKTIAEEIYSKLAQEIKLLIKAPRLAAVLVASADPSSQATKKFLELKKSAAQKIGVDFHIYEFPETITTKELRKKVADISKSKINDGVLIELPLPAHMNTQAVLNGIGENKDVDVLSQKCQGKIFAGRSKILPPAVEALKIIFEKFQIEIQGKNCVVFGYGLLVGKPISHWLSENKATVSIINETTVNPEDFSQKADIIISGVGKPALISAVMVKNGVIVVDFGFNYVQEKIMGDVDFESISKKAALITPVPGGVGPIVIASVFKNLLGINPVRNNISNGIKKAT